tara:strand:+ start:95 stop:496 length:402 start_codon:yes stop_codon:yes gene_type:complete
MTNPVGRPTSLTPELLEKAWAYILMFTDKETIPEDEVIPSIEGLAIYVDVNRTTLYEWDKKENTEFNNIMDTLRALQGRTLLNGSLTNKLNANISKAILSRHGYSEKSETKQEVTHNINEEQKDQINKALSDM